MVTASDEQKGRSGAFRRGLLLYGSTAAIAAALMVADGGIGPAMAQEIGPRISPTVSAQGDFNVGGATPSPYFEYRSGTLDIVYMPRDAVLNWTTYDTAPNGGANGSSYVNFLPKDTELRFTGNGQSFTAVNRIFTTPDNAGVYRGIAFQGQVTSYLYGDGPTSVGPVGGNIWFYSPGGILATGSASFNVGSLLLSASDITNFGSGNGYRFADFSGVASPFASVVLQTGARVNLTQPGSSLAIIAPTIEQSGDVFVNGSVLYLSAEQGSISLDSSGYISAFVDREAVAGNEIRHFGTTIGPASIGTQDYSVYDPQTIEFRTGRDVGVLLSGTIGYAPATDAALLPNGAIQLTSGAVTSQGDLTFTSDTSINANMVTLRAGTGETITGGSDVNGGYDLYAKADLEGVLGADAGGVIDFAGSVTFASPDQVSTQSAFAAGATGNAPGGSISIGGALTIDASVGYDSFGNQQAGRAEVTIGDGGSISVGGNMGVLGDYYATDDANNITSAHAGEAILGLTGANSRLTVGGALTVSAAALPFSGRCECYINSGSATGGYASLTSNAGTITANSLVVSADAKATLGQYGYDQGQSLDAAGGTALVQFFDSTIAIQSIAVTANAYAAQGASGQVGGSATGGTAQFSKGTGGSLTAGLIGVNAQAVAGAGGNGNGDGSYAAAGGNARGGNVSVALLQQAQTLTQFGLDASAYGAQGGSEDGAGGESGAAGGTAAGGTAELYLSGAGNVFSGLSESNISVGTYGGDGGSGTYDYYNEVQGGSGGAGGATIGGTLTITAANGAEYVSPGMNIASFGGTGGTGGNGSFGDSGIVAPGAGGIGGDATGANVTIVADGGLISGDLQLLATGDAGFGGANGYDAYENYTGSVARGILTGGTISLQALDNGPSRFDLSNALLYTSGDTAGTIEILDQSTDAGASLHFGQLSATSTSNLQDGSGFVNVFAGNNAIVVDGYTGIEADSLALDFSGSGRLEVGGYTQLTGRTGGIVITHVNSTGGISIDSQGPFQAYATGDYSAGADTIVRSGQEVDIRALGAVFAADTRGAGTVTISAATDTTVGNVTANPGYYAGGDVNIYAGRYEFDATYAYDTGNRATVTGAVVAGGSVLIESGGFAEFASGSQVLSDNAITVRTGDDILIRSGASFVSDIDPYLYETIYLLAGDINVGGGIGDLVDPITTPIASLVIAGSIDTNGRDLYLSGDAIDGTGSAISTGSLYADVTDIPFIPPYSNDVGLLTSGCFQGSICLGTVTATGDVAIGLASNNGLNSLRTGAIDFSGTNFEVVTFDRIDLGGGSLPGMVAASGRISLTSQNDSIGLTNLTLQAPDLRISAGGSLEAATSSLFSPNSIVLQVGSSVSSNVISTGGALDDGSDSGVFHVAGTFDVDTLIYGGTNPIAIMAGGDLSIGFADANGSDIALQARQALFLGSTAANARNIDLAAASIAFNNLYSTGLVRLTASSGGILGVSETSPAIDTNGNIVLDAAGDITVDSLAADGSISISGGAVTVADLAAGGAIDFAALNAGSVDSFSSGANANFSGASLSLGTGTAGGALTAQASAGDLRFTNLSVALDAQLDASGALIGGNVAAGRTLTLGGASVALGTGAGTTGVSASTPGAASFASLSSANGAIALDAGGAVSGGSASAGGSVTVAGASVALGAASFGNGLAITARSGDLSGAGLYQGTDAVALQAAQGIAIGSVDALGGISLQAGAEARFVELRSRDGSVGVNAAGAILGSSVAATGSNPAGDDSVSLTAGGAITLDGTTAVLNAVSSAQDDFTASAGGALAIVRAEAGRDLALSAGAGTLSADNVASGRDLSLSGLAVELNAGDVARNLTVRATSGDITGSGVTTAGGAIDLGASGAIAVGSMAANGGGLTANAAGSIVFADLAAAGDVTLNAGTGIAGSGDIVAAGGVDLFTTSGATALRDIQAGGAVALSGGGTLAMLDIMQVANGSLTVTYGGAIALRDASAATGVDIAGGADVAFGKIRTPGSIALDAAGAVSGSVLDATNAVSASGTSVALGSVAVGEGNATLLATAGGLSADSVSAYNIDARASGALGIATTAASQSATLSGTNLALGSVTAGNDLTLATGEGGDIAFASAVAGDQAAVQAGGAVSGGTLTAGDFASVDASGAIGLTGLTAGDASLRSAGGAVTASGIAVSGLLDASGAALTLNAPGTLTVAAQASAGDIAITTGSDLVIDATATGAIALASTGGSVFIGSVGQGGGDGDGIGSEAVSGGSAVAVTAANAISVADSLTAGGALTMTAGGLVSLDGAATGQTIALQAADLAIGADGTLGSAATQRISLASTAQVNLGTGASGGFAVDQAEFTRIHSGGDLVLTALSGEGGGSLTVSNLAINAGSGGQIGISGIFGLTSSGLVDVNGTLGIAGAGTGNTLSLTGDTIDLDYANAALAVMSSANAATGRIVANGRLITSLSASAAADIVGKTPDEISLRLGRAEVVRSVGLFQTSNLTLQGRDAILIQNSGSSAGVDDRRGLTVGALTVTGAADGHTLVVINGVVDTQTGVGAAQRLILTTPIAGGSSFNGCVLANIAGCIAVIPPPDPIPEPEPLVIAPDSILFGTADLIKDEDEDDEVEDGVADGKPEAPPIDTHNIDDPAGRPMIDDPVTGAGNEDLWQPPEG